MPLVTFQSGVYEVALVVDDGLITSVPDTTIISVADTTPPVVVCPANLIIECSAAGGTPATAPAIVAFLAAASASDTCDAAVPITNDAPGFFPLGATSVTFSAQDDTGNPAQCVASVTVQDTTPPLIQASVDPDSLWPPDHKLRTITADVDVTDVCDPAPIFTLSSIVSSEPDDAKGDGNTSPDVANAAFGTPDTSFSLRSERSGKGPGRHYTIRYLASDASNNASLDTASVNVAHDRR
jgi:hypothetical protein